MNSYKHQEVYAIILRELQSPNLLHTQRMTPILCRECLNIVSSGWKTLAPAKHKLQKWLALRSSWWRCVVTAGASLSTRTTFSASGSPLPVSLPRIFQILGRIRSLPSSLLLYYSSLRCKSTFYLLSNCYPRGLWPQSANLGLEASSLYIIFSASETYCWISSPFLVLSEL